MKTVNLIVSVILLIAGVFYALLPHSMHISSGLDFGLSHNYHIVIGVILLILGILLILIKKK